ncbi:MAG: FG-GAP-like repeat-containing protein [Edaphobacter sp.]
MSRKLLLSLVCFALISAMPMFGSGPSFHPDVTFKGSSLAGWHTLGQANWRAENGELIGTPKQGAGGWLVLDRSYQDIGLFTDFRCTGGCETGVLFRAEKTPDGMKGVYVSLTPDIKYYDVTLDGQGKILSRVELRRGGGQMRIAPPFNPNAPARAARRPAGSAQFNIYNPTPGLPLPFLPPNTDLRPNEWNTMEYFFDANILRGILNYGRETGGVGDETGYGPIALYVGGSGEVQFKDLAYKNLNQHFRAPEETGRNFSKQRLNDFYYSWGAAAADFNHDGVLDVVSGPYIYTGPDYRHYSEIYPAVTSNPSTEYTNDDWMEFAGDFEGNGWPDVLTCSFANPGRGCFLYVNSRGEPRRWDKHEVVSDFQTEIAVVRDVDGDGKLGVVYGGGGYVRYAKPDPANPTGPWVVHNVSEHGYATAHGIGVGDINGDGRMDIVSPYGWWEHPAAGANPPSWVYHPEEFGRYARTRMGGSVMAVYDVNGDGLNDVVTALDAHGWGLAWFEQKRDAQGKSSFVRHMIMDDFSTKNAGGVTFSELHGTTFADMNGDGIPDFVAGKRYWSHRDDYLDPYPYGPPLLYYYQTVRNPKLPGGAEFVPHLIDNHSGSGSDLLAVDLNKDGAMDIVTATRFGTFIFWGTPHAGKSAERKKSAQR